ncbi:MAG: ADP-forming succinate--CoA ligase subunit beta [Dehalococcoidia bacterium]|nr:ADP-forming succinate--CoA ligase subunit beta [Dehalococcoidia bacterium]
MKLFEFEAKQIMRQCGLATPRGGVAASPAEAAAIARELGTPVALKAQILVAGRGKAGGIAFADNPEAAGEVAAKLVGATIKGCRVDKLLVEEKLNIADQFYASLTIDRQARKYVALASADGGVDIEQVAAESASAIARHRIDPDAGFAQSEAEALVGSIPKISQHMLKSVHEKKVDPNLKGDVAAFASALATLFRLATEYDAELVEINPLVKVASGEFVAADARIILDDNALFRHPEFGDRGLARADDTPKEAEARKQDLTYVDLSGDIGIVGNGAGLVMATMDLIRLHGGEPANFLDIGGGAEAHVISKGLTFVMSKPDVKAVLINVLGGITRCDEVAKGVIEALNGTGAKKPIAVRMMGTNEQEGTEMLRHAGVTVYADMETAADEIMKLKGRQAS